MHNSKTLFNDFINQVRLADGHDEIESIAALVFENLFGLTRSDILAGKHVSLLPETEQKLSTILARINSHEPVQYIFGEADFFGRKFIVNKSVLIPRPETEELIILIKSCAEKKSGLRMLDIGTGSGCIPVTLSLEIPTASVWATDVSSEALEVAQQNARNLKASVSFIDHNILEQEIPLTTIDVIVSNPPYITVQQKQDMNKNVVEYEPHLALFVPDDDPLQFYKAIATKSWSVLSKSGLLAVEINEKLGKEVATLFTRAGFSGVRILKDINGKDRIVKGIKVV